MEKQESGSGEVLIASLREKFHQKVPSRILRVLLILCVSSLATQSYNPFIYFRV